MWPWKDRSAPPSDVWEVKVEDQLPGIWHVWRVHFPMMVLTYDVEQDGERLQSREYRCRRSESGTWECRLTEDSAKALRTTYEDTLRSDPRAALREARPASAHLLDRLRKTEIDAADAALSALDRGPSWEPFDAPELASLERAYQQYKAR